MSLIGTVANYGGKQPSNTQDIKQFVVGGGGYVVWIYKKLPTGLQVITLADSKKSVYLNNDLYVNGSIYNTSDAKLKENIVSLHEDRKSRLLELKPVEYSFKVDNTHKPHYGFIAQDVEKLFPTLVETNANGHKTVNYFEFIPILISKVQDMQKEIDELKGKL
jgi:hypothetical protein